MAFLSEDNKEIGLPMELSIFASPPNQVAIDKITYTEERPISNLINDSTPIEIVISGAGNDYIDLRKSRLFVKLQILKEDGSYLQPKEKTGIINLPLQSMFSHIDVYMNNKLVSANSNNYPWKSYFKVILSSGSDEQNSQLQSQLFMKDDDPMDSLTLNAGYVNRYEYTKESRTFELESNLMEDALLLDKYLISGVDIYMKLFRSSAPFLLMSGEAKPNYKVKILDVFYRTARVKVDPGVILNHRRQIQESPAKYLINRSNVIQNVIPLGSTEFYWDSLFPKSLPSKVVFGLVPQKAINGDYTANPFNFQHFNMSCITLKVNGVEVYGSPLNMDFSNNRNYTAAYVRLFEICDKWQKDTGLNISLNDFGNGYTFIVFSLDPSDFQEDFLNLVKHGNARLEIRFSVPTTEVVNCMCYYQSQAILTCDETRNINIVEP
ncbi:uncharacterized protein F54H12.2-like [Mytilus edulis]|uniref:Uncharacterized protein n=2 Tax=Mytilus TaxID=6548 RepID=A0A8B6G0V8_MYTGA|nr:unnamed protein product [Mytilus edulis]VDI57142.1 Hypothetical predicted protein [Mytilus galloprovincialis]